MNEKRNIFLDLDETLWHSSTRMYMENRRLLPDSLCELTGPEYFDAIKKAINGIESRAKDILNDKGLVEFTFEHEVAMSGARDQAFIELCVENGWKEFWITDTEWYVSRLRPNAEKFLIEMSKLGNVYACTSSTWDYATGLAELHGIKAYFKGFITRSELHAKTVCPFNVGTSKWVLVDDLPPFAESMKKKMFCLAAVAPEDFTEISRHLVQVPEWNGDPKDDILLGTAEGIKERLDSISD